MSRVESPPRARKIAAYALVGAMSLFGIDEVVEFKQESNEFYRDHPQVSWSEGVVSSFKADVEEVIKKKDIQGLANISNSIPVVESALRNLDEVSGELDRLKEKSVKVSIIAVVETVGLYVLTLYNIIQHTAKHKLPRHPKK